MALNAFGSWIFPSSFGLMGRASLSQFRWLWPFQREIPPAIAEKGEITAERGGQWRGFVRNDWWVFASMLLSGVKELQGTGMYLLGHKELQEIRPRFDPDTTLSRMPNRRPKDRNDRVHSHGRSKILALALRAKTMAVAGPWLVMVFPSTTTRSSTCSGIWAALMAINKYENEWNKIRDDLMCRNTFLSVLLYN